MNRSIVLIAPLALAVLSVPALAGDKPPVVVELFTSQGCSSCPPANANLIKLTERDDVLALSFSITYWDYLGWKDIFGDEAYTDRQKVYESPLGEPGPFTPQMVFNGVASAVGNNLAEVEGLVDRARPLDGPAVTLSAHWVEIAAAPAPSAGADVWLVRYDPGIVEVPVGRGENTGHTLPHTHVVHDLQRLGTWDGSLVSFDVASAVDGYSTAILVQGLNGGPILSAATD